LRKGRNFGGGLATEKQKSDRDLQRLTGTRNELIREIWMGKRGVVKN